MEATEYEVAASGARESVKLSDDHEAMEGGTGANQTANGDKVFRIKTILKRGEGGKGVRDYTKTLLSTHDPFLNRHNHHRCP